VPDNTTNNLRGRVVAVTGGANGIGLAVARRFAAAGAKVAIGDLDAAAASAAADALGDGALGLALDVRDRDAFAAFLDAAEADHGPLDVLVNNAGVDWVGPFHEEPDAVTRREVDVNLMGTIYGTRLAVQRMLPRDRGHVVNVASGVGRLPLPGSASYSATKHAIVGLTESLRLEYRRTGLRFSMILPAQVETAMLDGQARPRLMSQVTADDVAAGVLRAVQDDRFEVWVPGSTAAGARLAALLPRRLRDAALLTVGIARLAEGTDQAARRDYHERMFDDHRS
jgi:NAD(P)-dependent dehydrogenase (short-subunit alcohol dehydrogenase family)